MQFCALSGGLETIYFKIPKTLSTSQWLGFLKHCTNEKCPDSSSALTQPISFVSAPNVLVLEINSRNLKISKTLKFVQDGESVVLKGRGLDTMQVSFLHLVSLELITLCGIILE